MPHVVGDVIRRLVFRYDEDPVLPPKQIGIPPQLLFIVVLVLVALVLVLVLVLAWCLNVRQSFDEIRLFLEQKNFNWKLTGRNLAEGLRKCSDAAFEICNETPALHVAGVGAGSARKKPRTISHPWRAVRDSAQP